MRQSGRKSIECEGSKSEEAAIKKILLLESQGILKFLYEREITEMGYEVVSAREGQEAIEIITCEDCRLIIVDLGLPEMKDFAVIRSILNYSHDMPFLIYSVYDYYQINCLTWIERNFVVNSFGLKEISPAIRWILSKSRREKIHDKRASPPGINRFSQ